MRKRRTRAEMHLSKPTRSQGKRPTWLSLETPPIHPRGMTLEQARLWWVQVRQKAKHAPIAPTPGKPARLFLFCAVGQKFRSLELLIIWES